MRSLGENSWSGWGRIGVSGVPWSKWSGDVEEDCYLWGTRKREAGSWSVDVLEDWCFWCSWGKDWCLWGPWGRVTGVVMCGRIGVSEVPGGR